MGELHLTTFRERVRESGLCERGTSAGVGVAIGVAVGDATVGLVGVVTIKRG